MNYIRKYLRTHLGFQTKKNIMDSGIWIQMIQYLGLVIS